MTQHSQSRIGLGLAAIGRPAYTTVGRDVDLGDPSQRTTSEMQDRAHRLLDAAWDAGVRYFDAARSSGHAENFLGSWLAAHPGRRREATIGSEWGYEYVGRWRIDATQHERKDHSRVMFATQWPQSLQALGATPDIYLIHSVTPDSLALTDTGLLERLRQLVDMGVRVGISTSGPAQRDVIDQALTVPRSPLTVVQTTWNVLEQYARPH